MDGVCIARVAHLWAAYMATYTHSCGDVRESPCAGISQGHPIPVREGGRGGRGGGGSECVSAHLRHTLAPS